MTSIPTPLINIHELKGGQYSFEIAKSSEWIQEANGNCLTFITLNSEELERISDYLRQYLVDSTIKKLGEPL